MERLNYNQLFYFNTIAQEGSLAKASTKLGVSSSNLSEQMRLLERSFSMELFDRDGQHLQLTSKGRQLYEFSRRIFLVGDQLQKFVDPTIDSQLVLTIGIASSISRSFASDYLSELLSNPGVLFRSKFGSHDFLLKELGELQLDVLITDTNPEEERRDRIESTLVASSPWIVVCSGSHADLAERYKQRDASVPFIMHPTASSYRWICDRYLEEIGLTPQVIAEIDDNQLILRAVSDGVGLALLPQIMLNGDLTSKKLLRVDEMTSHSANVYLVHASNRTQAHVARAIELLKKPRTL